MPVDFSTMTNAQFIIASRRCKSTWQEEAARRLEAAIGALNAAEDMAVALEYLLDIEYLDALSRSDDASQSVVHCVQQAAEKALAAYRAIVPEVKR